MTETRRCLDELLGKEPEIKFTVDTNGENSYIIAEVDDAITSAAGAYVLPYLKQQQSKGDPLPQDVGRAILSMKETMLRPFYGDNTAEQICSYVQREMEKNQPARTALVLMSDATDRDAQRALLVKKALEEQHGLYHVEMVNNVQAAINYLRDTHLEEHLDLMVLGEGFDKFGHTVESGKNKDIVTIAVSTNGVRADVKLPDTDSLMDLMWTTGKIQEIYRSNMDAQRYRRAPVDITLEIPKPEGREYMTETQ
ncbi:hypothetical protein KY363_02730 [Candidatus Woesearchaeota archaeon]|nr:hypothetical protein [Candidatus Woesearchaeota archaeon]